MSIFENVIKGPQIKPRRTVIYGTHGIGKTTWAACWDNPLIIQTEEGSDEIGVDRLPVAQHFAEVYSAFEALAAGGHDYKTVVLDSADWLELLVQKYVCQQGNKNAITDFDFGKGYGASASIFREIIEMMTKCNHAGMHIVVVAHCDVYSHANPEGASYDRYRPKMHTRVSELLQEWASEVLFATYKVYVRTEEEGFNRERGIGVGTGERIIYTQERPGYMAKNRLNLPAELPLDFSKYRPFLTGEKK